MIDFGLDVFNKFLRLLRLIVVAVAVVVVVAVVAVVVVVALVVVVVVVVINYNFCHISSSNFPFLGSHANKLIRKTEVMSVVGFLQVSSECHHMNYSIIVLSNKGQVHLVLVSVGFKACALMLMGVTQLS